MAHKGLIRGVWQPQPPNSRTLQLSWDHGRAEGFSFWGLGLPDLSYECWERRKGNYVSSPVSGLGLSREWGEWVKAIDSCTKGA